MFVLNKLLLDGNPKFCGCDCIVKLPKSDKSPKRSELFLEITVCAEGPLIVEVPPIGDRFPGITGGDTPVSKLGTLDDVFGGGITFGKTLGILPTKLGKAEYWELFWFSEKAAVKSANPSSDFKIWMGLLGLPNAVSKSPNSLIFLESLLSPALGSKSSLNKLLAERTFY